jgi:uncharacterized membrane protein
MSQRCPVCKSRLWTDPLFTPSRLVCPRCGAIFKPTVPWASFRILVVLVLALSIALLVFLVGYEPWILIAFLAALFVFLWNLPRLVNLQHISKELSLSDGVMDPDEMRLKIDDQLAERKEQAQEEHMFRNLLGLIVIAALFTLALLWLLRQ